MVIGPSFRPPSASATPSATPRITTGNDQITSSTALIPASVLPPKKPARMPRLIESRVVMIAAASPITSELRPP